MLEWLKQQVNWLISTATSLYSWVIKFIQDPYPTLRNVLDWVYNRAVWFVNAVKSEIANWTYGLITGLWNWVNWIISLYNNEIAPRLNSLWNTIQNVATTVWAQIKPIFDQAVANLWSWIVWLDNTIKSIRQDIYNTWNSVQGWVVPKINKLVNDVGWLLNKSQQIDFGKIYDDIGKILKWIYDFDILFYKKLGDTLLELLEELLAEAME